MHHEQAHIKLFEEAFVRDHEAAYDFLDARDRDLAAGASRVDQSAPGRLSMDSFVQRTNVLKILTGSPLDYRHELLPEERNP